MRLLPNQPSAEHLLDFDDWEEDLMESSELPHFKPKFAHVFLLGSEAVCRVLLVEEVGDVGLFRKGFCGAEGEVGRPLLLDNHIAVDGDGAGFVG